MTVNIERMLPNQFFFTPAEVADLFDVKTQTVIGWLKNKEHPLEGVKLSNKLWRIPRENLIQYLEIRYGKQQ